MAVGSGVCAGDPGRQQLVGIRGKVIADEDVEQGVVAAQVSTGQDDQLALARRSREAARSIQMSSIAGDQGGGHEQDRVVTPRRAPDDLDGNRRIARDQPADEAGMVIGTAIRVAIVGEHALSVSTCADDALTAADGR